MIVVFDYSWIRLANRKPSDAAFGNRHRHPGRFSGAIAGIFDHSHESVSYTYRAIVADLLLGRPAVHGRNASIMFERRQGPVPNNAQRQMIVPKWREALVAPVSSTHNFRIIRFTFSCGWSFIKLYGSRIDRNAKDRAAVLIPNSHNAPT
ncbi:hypothetical protein [Pararobbsia alpina]|uniref:hypothetical protein n=1 Tax=Pararobbsia alpina TaxID=621374 RepID=UPI001582F1BB|nr:hypothetical protein [Pararobbsia alpina]